MNILYGGLIAVILCGGCAGTVTKRIPLPPEIIEIPVVVPLPKECAKLQVLPLPLGTTAAQMMEEQHKAILAYKDQIKRCMQAQRPAE